MVKFSLTCDNEIGHAMCAFDVDRVRDDTIDRLCNHW